MNPLFPKPIWLAPTDGTTIIANSKQPMRRYDWMWLTFKAGRWESKFNKEITFHPTHYFLNEAAYTAFDSAVGQGWIVL